MDGGECGDWSGMRAFVWTVRRSAEHSKREWPANALGVGLYLFSVFVCVWCVHFEIAWNSCMKIAVNAIVCIFFSPLLFNLTGVASFLHGASGWNPSGIVRPTANKSFSQLQSLILFAMMRHTTVDASPPPHHYPPRGANWKYCSHRTTTDLLLLFLLLHQQCIPFHFADNANANERWHTKKTTSRSRTQTECT